MVPRAFQLLCKHGPIVRLLVTMHDYLCCAMLQMARAA